MKFSHSLTLFIFGSCLIFSLNGYAASSAPEISPSAVRAGDSDSAPNSARSASTLALRNTDVANLFVKRHTITVGPMGKQTWQAKYIYNADRTQANIFNPANDSFVTTLGAMPVIAVASRSAGGAQTFSASKPRYVFKSASGAAPALSVVFNEQTQTILVKAVANTPLETLPAVLQNRVQFGTSSFVIDESFDATGTFTPTAGYRSTAFVVSAATLKMGKPGNDSVMLSLLLGDPAFLFPAASGARTVRLRITNVLNQVVIDSDISNAVVARGTILSAPAGAFRYNSSNGNMSFKLTKASLAGLLVTSEEHVRVDVTLGDKTYTTRVTLFSPGCRKTVVYSTIMPTKFCNFTPGRINDTTPPAVLYTLPADMATNVPANTKISATFSESMDPQTLSDATFFLMEGSNAVSGSISHPSGDTVVFTPNAALAFNTDYTATITTGAKDPSGNALAADVTWTFKTGATIDTLAPNVLSTNPNNQASNVPVNQSVNASFDEAIDPSTLTTSTFTLTGPGVNPNPIAGKVTYDAANKIASFKATNDLAPNTLYTATLTSGIKDLAGNALTQNTTWTFTTGSQQALQPMTLGAAASFGTFGGGAGMTSEGLFTVVNGDISTTGASTTVTGFHDSTGDIYTETPLNKGQVNGRIYTAPPTPGGAGVGGNASTFAIATQGAADAQKAYDNLSPATLPGGTDPGAGELGGLTLPSGIYKAAGGTFQITGSDLTLDAHGDTNAVWVFQSDASLTVGAPGAPRTVLLTNGAKAKNVFWRVGSAATINAAGGGTMVGTILAYSGVSFSTSGNVTLVTLNGRALGLHASTTLVNTVINVPAP